MLPVATMRCSLRQVNNSMEYRCEDHLPPQHTGDRTGAAPAAAPHNRALMAPTAEVAASASPERFLLLSLLHIYQRQSGSCQPQLAETTQVLLLLLPATLARMQWRARRTLQWLLLAPWTRCDTGWSCNAVRSFAWRLSARRPPKLLCACSEH